MYLTMLLSSFVFVNARGFSGGHCGRAGIWQTINDFRSTSHLKLLCEVMSNYERECYVNRTAVITFVRYLRRESTSPAQVYIYLPVKSGILIEPLLINRCCLCLIRWKIEMLDFKELSYYHYTLYIN